MKTALPGSLFQVSETSLPSTVSEWPSMRARETSKCLPPTLNLTVPVASDMMLMGNCTMNESGRVLIVRGSLVGRARQWVDAVKNHLRQKWPDFAVNFNRTILRRVIHTQTLSFDKCLYLKFMNSLYFVHPHAQLLSHIFSMPVFYTS